MILMIDNYDSFTYNLVQYLGQLGEEVTVRRNDEITLDEIEAMKPEAIFLSPGPCSPDEAGITVDVIRTFHQRIPLMGVCLGHQAIGQAFGGSVVRAGRIMHGKTSPILNDGRTIFRGLPSPFPAGRYHSLLVERESLPECLEVSAQTEEGGDHGASAPPIPRGGDPVSPGIDPHARGKEDHPQFFAAHRQKGEV